MSHREIFERGLHYHDFLVKHGTAEHRQRWESMHRQIRLTKSQTELLANFHREMKVICVAGTWCGDCVNQCPILDHFSQASSKLEIRFFDRDTHSDLANELAVCGAPRVPSVLFLSEDCYPCGRYGDRTLSRYRQLAGQVSGAACSTGIVVAGDEERLAAVVQEWLNEFERIQLMLRLSGRLRKLHGD